MRIIPILTVLAAVTLPLAAEADIYVVTASGLNVRKKATSSSRILGVAPRGARLMGERKRDGQRWVRVSYNGQSGYVFARYVRYERPEDDAEAFANNSRNTTTIQQAQVTARSGLNIRSGPSSRSSRVGSALPRGASVTVLKQQGNWSLVKAGNRGGWVYNRYLRTTSESPSASRRSRSANSLPASFSRSGGSSASSSSSSSASSLFGGSSGSSSAGSGNAPWLAIARGQMGISERTSAGRARIRQYHQRGVGVGYSHNTAWCASFMNWVLKSAGYRGTGSAMARSFERYGQRLSEPRQGAIVVFWRVSRSSGKGHVGLYMGESGNSIRVLGGNQSNSVRISSYPKSRLLGYRWPSR